MAYSDDDIRELCLETDRILIDGDKFNDKVASLEDLQKRLKRKAKFKEVNFQDKCEGDNSLGDLLLKHATENDNSRVKDFLLNNGFTLPQQEQITAAVNEEEEQSTPDVEENEAEPSSADSSNSGDTQFAMSYKKMKEIVTKNPNITAEEFSKELKKEKVDIKITNQDGWTLLYYAVRSEGPSITDGRDIFLKIVKLLANSGIKVNDIQDTAYTLLDRAATIKQADIVKILLDSGKFNEEEKLQALNFAIVQGNAQEAQSFLGHIKYEEALRVLSELKTQLLREEKGQVEGIGESLNMLRNEVCCKEKKETENIVQKLSTLETTLLHKKKEQIEGIKPLNTLRNKASHEEQIENIVKDLNTLGSTVLHEEQKEQIKGMIKALDILKTKVLSEKKIEDMIKAIDTLKKGVLCIENTVNALNELKLENLSREQEEQLIKTLDKLKPEIGYIEDKVKAFNTPKSEVSHRKQEEKIINAFDTLRTIVLHKEQIEDMMKTTILSKKQVENMAKVLNTSKTENLSKKQVENMAKVLNTLKTTVLHREKIEVMRQFFECNKDLTEEEKVKALSDAVMEYDAPKVNRLLEYMVGIPEVSIGSLLKIMKQNQSSLKKESKLCPKTNTIILLLESAVKNGEKEKQKAPHIETNSASSSSRNADSRPVATVPPVSFNNNDLLNHNRSSGPTATVPPISTNGDNCNHDNEIPVVTINQVVTMPSVKENKPKPSGNVGYKPVPPVVLTNASATTTSSGDNGPHDFIGPQFSPPNEEETKYKESKENFHTSLRNDVVGVVITGLFIAVAVMVPSIAGAAVCGIVAALALVATGLHVKDSTLPSYKEMEENRVERISQNCTVMI
jgi:ankyrin repeat protein